MDMKSLLRRPFRYAYWNVTIILIVANVIAFLSTLMMQSNDNMFGNFMYYLVLNPRNVVEQGFIWQLVTYMFLHGGYMHLLFNMFALFMFGIQLEKAMGSKEFLLFYLVMGILSGLSAFIVSYDGYMLGASGAIYGVLLAFAVLFPNTRILLFFVIPMKAPLAVLIFAIAAIVLQLTNTMPGVAHFAHLAGLIFGAIYFIIRFGINPIKVFIDNIRRR
ncbi:MAG: rhomboid family intramembrane serine protease [Spirochaetales bacterium]|nr:rhomboid family intramembrane serine protease [Spirochaetales bacterium]